MRREDDLLDLLDEVAEAVWLSADNYNDLLDRDPPAVASRLLAPLGMTPEDLEAGT